MLDDRLMALNASICTECSDLGVYLQSKVNQNHSRSESTASTHRADQVVDLQAVSEVIHSTAGKGQESRQTTHFVQLVLVQLIPHPRLYTSTSTTTTTTSLPDGLLLSFFSLFIPPSFPSSLPLNSHEATIAILHLILLPSILFLLVDTLSFPLYTYNLHTILILNCLSLPPSLPPSSSKPCYSLNHASRS